jgi:hypothetical protein
MKQKRFLLLAILLIVSIACSNQSIAQNSCSNPNTIYAQDLVAVRNGSLSEVWYNFTATEDTIDLEVNSIHGTLVNKIEIYSGSCGSLTRIGYDTISNGADSVLRFNQSNLVLNNVYKIKVSSTAPIVKYDLMILTVRGPFLMVYDGNQIPYSYCVNQNGVGNSQIICGVTGNCNLVACPTQTLYLKLFLNNNCSCASGTTNWYFSGLIPNITNLSYTLDNMNNCPGINPFIPVVIPANANGGYLISANILSPCLPCISTGTMSTEQFSLNVIPNFTTAPIVPISPICTNILGAIDLGAGTSVSTYTYGDLTSDFGNPTHLYTNSGLYNITKEEKYGFCSGQVQTAQVQVNDLEIDVTIDYVCGTNVNIIKNFSCNLSATGTYYNTWNIFNSSGTNIYSTSSGTNTTINYVFPANGTYTISMSTVVLSGPGAGTYYDTQVVTINGNTVNPTPIITTPSSTAICIGQSITLTASGVNTYTWNTGANTTTIVVSPTVTTNYTVSGTNPCGTNTAVATVSVMPLPVINAVANPTAVCLGYTSTVTASGASTYTWNTGATSSSISVTPSVTTIYTVTGTSSVGCINTKTVSVTIKPLPSLTINPSYNAVCVGGNFTITASGASSYSWSTGATTNSITIAALNSTKVFTVTGTGSNGCVKVTTYTLYANPLPTLTVTASPTLVCLTSSTLAVFGASTYTWNTGATTSTINVTPTTTTVYTVTGTSSVGCVAQNTVSVYYGSTPPFVTVISNTNIICSGTTTLTANGGASYTWTPSGATTATIAVNPTVATVYTISSTYGLGCGVYTYTTLVNPVVSTLCCSAPTGTIGTSLTSTVYPAAGSFTNTSAIINVQGVVNFTANTSYTGYTFRMAPGALLRVDPNKTLTLTNCKLFSCSELWDGILLREDNLNFGNLVLNNTTIEDMYNGIVVDYDNNRINSAAPSGSITINNSTLNKNYISVQMKNSPGMSSGSGYYPFSMTTSTISSTTSTTSPGSSLKPSSTYTYAYNQITNGSTGSSAPYLNFPRSFIGIQLNNLGYESSVNIGSRNSSTLTNTFNNLDFGINGTEVYTKVYNNYFKNITGSVKSTDPSHFGNTPAQGPDEIGIAISITQTTTANYNSCYIGANPSIPTNTNSPYPDGNLFEDCNKGVKATNNRYVTVLGNVFTTTTTSIPVSTTSGSPPMFVINPNTYYYYTGQNAVWSSALGTKADLSYNYIRNHSTGIYDSHSINPTISGTVTVQGNDIAAPASTGYCRQAIQIDQAGGQNIPTDQAYIYSNRLENVYRGVISNGVLSGLLIKSNTINVEGVAKTLNYSASSQRTGVALTNCQYASVKGNSFTQNGSVPTTTTTALAINGVYVTNSINTKVECNSATSLGRCFVFQQTCSGSSWKVNAMSNSYTGLEIRTIGTIGQQGSASGSPGSPNLSANTWTNITRQTNAVSSPSVNVTSKLYLLAGATTQPTLNFSQGGSAAYSTTLTGINVTSGTSYTCNSGSAQRLINSDSNNSSTNSGNSAKMSQETDTLMLYTLLATQSEDAYEVFPEEMSYINQQSVYKLLKEDSIHAINGTNLDEFFNEQQNTAIDMLTEVQQAIANYDTANALLVNGAIITKNTVESKHQRANELVLKYMQNHAYSFSPTEISDLFSMASECIEKGYYVVQCRNLVNAIQNTVINYTDNCEQEANASRRQKPVTLSGAEGQKTNFYIYPNPNNGNMILEYDLVTYSNAKVNLFDITGKVISSYKLNETKGILQMNEQNLNNGVYFYRILVGEKTIKTDKIVIIK